MTCMGLRRLGSLSFLENLKMAGVVQFHAKLLTSFGPGENRKYAVQAAQLWGS